MYVHSGAIIAFDLREPVQLDHFKIKTGFTQVPGSPDPNAFLHFSVDSLV